MTLTRSSWLPRTPPGYGVRQSSGAFEWLVDSLTLSKSLTGDETPHVILMTQFPVRSFPE